MGGLPECVVTVSAGCLTPTCAPGQPTSIRLLDSAMQQPHQARELCNAPTQLTALACSRLQQP